MQDQMQDLMDTHNEIQDIMSRSYAVPDGVDEDDLEAGMCFTPLPLRH